MLSAEEAKGLSIHDIVMPLPGYDVIYPSHHGKISVETQDILINSGHIAKLRAYCYTQDIILFWIFPILPSEVNLGVIFALVKR